MRYQRDGFSVKSGRLKGRPDPEWFVNRPPEVSGSEFFYVAFRDLGTERVDDGPIPWTKAMAYADRKGLAPDVADAVWTVVHKMDLVERKWRADSLKEELSSRV